MCVSVVLFYLGMTDVSKETYVMERDILYGLADSLNRFRLTQNKNRQHTAADSATHCDTTERACETFLSVSLFMGWLWLVDR